MILFFVSIWYVQAPVIFNRFNEQEILVIQQYY